MKIFIALPLTHESRAAMTTALAPALARLPAKARRAEPEEWHLTLEYIGGVAADRFDALGAAVSQFTPGAPFTLETGDLGTFPSGGRARVFWLGVKGDLQPLLTLQKRIAELCAGLGFVSEPGEYVPHITLGQQERGSDARDWASSYGLKSTISLPMERLVVYESISGAKPRYRERLSLPLQYAEQTQKAP